MAKNRKLRIKRAKHLKQVRREAKNKGVTVRKLHIDEFNNGWWFI